MSFEGIILIDKYEDFTSFDIVAKMRGIARTKKVGHGGTLDPMATGVLPIFFGRATKACDIFPVQDKTYIATVKLGITTDTQDITGEILSQTDKLPTAKEVEEVLPKFSGKQLQIPPMYSAVRVDGRRLYDLARQGIEVKRKAREIIVHSILPLSFSEGEFVIEVDVSKGTYIRTLVHDIGVHLGCGATLSALRRTKACGFDIADAITLDEAQKLMDEGKLSDKLIKTEEVFSTLPKIILSPKDTAHYLNGVRFTAKRFGVNVDTGDIAVFSEENVFLGISNVNEDGMLICKKQFAIREG